MILAGLDFETANGSYGSICSVGCAVVTDGEVTERKEWLVKPHPTLDWMSRVCFAIHKISWYDLREAPEFPAVWPALRGFLSAADCVVIHNAPFDLAHLRTVLNLYALPPVKFSYACTLAMSKAAYPNLASHSLAAVAANLGLTFQHHDALEDAETCAKIAARAGNAENFAKSFEFLPEQV